MTKKKLALILAAAGVSALAFSMTACSKKTNEATYDTDIYAVYETYVAYAEESNTTPLSYEEWLSSIKGAKGDKGDKGETGATGNGVASVEKTSSVGLVDTYTITFTDGTTYQYTVTNGASGEKGDKGDAGEKGEQGDAHAHDFTYDTAAYEVATCENSGLTIKYCACGVSHVEVVEKLAHTVKASVSGEYLCLTCGNVFEDEAATEECLVQKLDMGDVKYTLSQDGSHYIAGQGSKMYSATEAIKILPEISGIPVTEIGATSSGFYKAVAGTEIVIPASVSTIGDRAFEGSKFTAITFESGSKVTALGAKTFYDCEYVTELTISKKVASIGEQAFYGCKSLTKINVEEGNADFVSENGILYSADGETLVAVPAAMEGELAVKEGVTTIGAYAVAACSGLTKITLPASVTAVKAYGLQNVSNGALQEVTVNGVISEVGERAFMCLNGLKQITLSAQTIGKNAFQSCKDLTTVNLNEGVKEIGEYAFQASGITSVNLPASLEKINSSAFTCYSLTTVTAAKNSKLTTIAGYAFQNAKLLTSIVVPASVKTIGKKAFNLCPSLNIYYEGTETAWSAYAVAADTTLKVYYYSAEKPEADGSFWYYGEDGSVAVWGAEATKTSDVLISHVYGAGGKGDDTPISNNFIALTNYGENSVDLTGYTVQYSTMRGAAATDTRTWSTFALNVIIPAGETFVILCKAETTTSAVMTFAEGEYNATWNIVIDNKQYSIRLCDKEGNTVDALGVAETAAGNEEGEGTLVTGISKQKVVYRTSKNDTNNNATDFAVVSLKGATAETAAQYKPTASKNITTTATNA